MEERGLSIGTIAKLAGVSRSVVQSWTANANPHNLQAVAKLAKALNIEFKELLLGESEARSLKEVSLGELFDEHELFDGICRVKLQRLTPKKVKSS
jgi:transcriptional regulator with XRE-family HTH domain